MDIITELNSDAHETPVVRDMLHSFFTQNPQYIEFMPCKNQTIYQRYYLWSSMPKEILIAHIRSAMHRYCLRQSPLTITEYKLHYELTLTLLDTQPNPLSLLQATVGKIINSRMFSINKCYYVYEKTQSGTPHVHMLIKPNEGKTITQSKIRKLFPHRFSFSKVRDLKKYSEYLIKDLDDDNHIEFSPFQNPPPADYASTQTLS